MGADARLYGGLFNRDPALDWDLDDTRLTYVHLVRGAMTINGLVLKAGDALLLEREPKLHLEDGADAEVLVFDLAPLGASR
jgi:hypothetical protein